MTPVICEGQDPEANEGGVGRNDGRPKRDVAFVEFLVGGPWYYLLVIIFESLGCATYHLPQKRMMFFFIFIFWREVVLINLFAFVISVRGRTVTHTSYPTLTFCR